MTKDEHVYDLYMSATQYTKITCDGIGCRKEMIYYNMAGYSAAEKAYEQGWRSIDKDTYCGRCAVEKESMIKT